MKTCSGTMALFIPIPIVDEKKSYDGAIMGILIPAAILGDMAYFVRSNIEHHAHVAIYESFEY